MSLPARRAFDGALPDGAETRLLRALHRPEPEARAAWEAFRDEVDDLVAFLSIGRPGRKALVPLVYDAVRERGLAVAPSERTYLKTAFLRERHRGRRYREIVGTALIALEAEGVEAVLLKGTALGLAVYREPGLRHSHDAELLVRAEDLERAGRALRSAGDWSPAPSLSTAKGDALVHGSGLPLLLWTDPFRSPLASAPTEAFWERSRPLPAAGGGARIPSPADHLLLVMGNAAYSRSRESLLWACDAARLVERTEVDWETFVETAAACGFRIPAYRMTDYLAAELAAAVPEETLAALERRSRAVGPLERDTALRAARVGSGGLEALMGSASGAGDRVRLLWWTLFPSPRYVRRLADRGRGSSLGLLYARRLGRYLRAALGGRTRGLSIPRGAEEA